MALVDRPAGEQTGGPMPELTLLVLRCADLAVSKRFYEALGLNFVAQSAEGGPTRWSATVADTVLELYPSGVREPSNTRLGLRVDDLPVRLGQALAAGGSTATRDGLPDPERAFVVDPDGNTVELSSAPGSLADEILALEMKLLTRNVRASRVELEQLLADDFSEFGSSGREYSKLEVIDTLVANPELAPEMLAMSEFRTLPLAANVVLATYSYRQSRRSSLWRKDTSGWRLVFHQAGPR